MQAVILETKLIVDIYSTDANFYCKELTFQKLLSVGPLACVIYLTK